MNTLEEYLESKDIEESKYDFIDRSFIDYFNEEWTIQHAQSYDDLKYEIYESKTSYDWQKKQADIIDKEFQYIKEKDDDAFVSNVKQINNMFTKVEQNAYISQIVGNIGSILKQKKWRSIDEAIKELVKSEEYIRYKKLKEFVMFVLADEQIQSRYVDVYKSITNTTLSDTKIVNQLDNKFNKFWSELQKAIYKYIEEHSLVKESSLSIDYKEFIRQ